MNYLFYSIVFLSLGGILLIFPLYRYYLKFDFFSKHALRNLVARHPAFFPESVIKESVKYALKTKNKSLLDALFYANTLKASSILKTKNNVLSLLLKAIDRPAVAVKQLEKLYKKNPQNQSLIVWAALLYENTGNQIRADLFWDRVNEKKLSSYFKACYLFHLGKIALKNGDLEYASRSFYEAASLFHRHKNYYSEAETYLFLGSVYRISFVSDVAETLFRSAMKIFQSLQYVDGEAQTLGNLGILMIGEERFDEAENYLNRAFDIYEEKQLFKQSAEILNQLALAYLLQKDFKKANKYLQKAHKIHSRHNNPNGIALSQEIKAYCFWEQHIFDKAATAAACAVSSYQKTNNVSGLLSSLYLQAHALFNLKEDISTETLLRQIIDIGKKDSGCFYLANAYNLLGIVYMRRHDFDRAKGLFQQSLDLEQRGVRLNALAIDYANMGLVENCRGHKEDAVKNIQMALNFAQEAADESLSSLLKKYSELLSN